MGGGLGGDVFHASGKLFRSCKTFPATHGPQKGPHKVRRQEVRGKQGGLNQDLRQLRHTQEACYKEWGLYEGRSSDKGRGIHCQGYYALEDLLQLRHAHRLLARANGVSRPVHQGEHTCAGHVEGSYPGHHEGRTKASDQQEIDEDIKPFIHSRSTHKSSAGGLNEPKFCVRYILVGTHVAKGGRGAAVTVFSKIYRTIIIKTEATGNEVDLKGLTEGHHLDFSQTDSTTNPLSKKKVSRGGVREVAKDEEILGAGKESDIEQ
ncbi:hypothetical protein BDK51DRAFT_32176 [Blyttiomyces helicus]|uniref:Uncharacterized protein n=1 Tax=Blyttiomyces helicus TaxID=388810 RepID=A0A4P9VXK2_9FUNG|nr:hypothetical protein BDK51DRAFT_32176 [Blyttiomyces helicus]|eukprot:RKO84454.1 hypothetical protein BDK51DRAFT_32176 [Blyttiomyces helicus]